MQRNADKLISDHAWLWFARARGRGEEKLRAVGSGRPACTAAETPPELSQGVERPSKAKRAGLRLAALGLQQLTGQWRAHARRQINLLWLRASWPSRCGTPAWVDPSSRLAVSAAPRGAFIIAHCTRLVRPHTPRALLASSRVHRIDRLHSSVISPRPSIPRLSASKGAPASISCVSPSSEPPSASLRPFSPRPRPQPPLASAVPPSALVSTNDAIRPCNLIYSVSRLLRSSRKQIPSPTAPLCLILHRSLVPT
ncbi:uncharacterized protein PAN0_005d2543 [Moesziomyces antarcticus]|uniref:Uncharacterized protein n=1 Tax=Pseudozyma antarctica TaxID=84753 RepID=A0A081CCD4_PSEA2|nr:uncharacterized protein PAN0_005d2543 [Moesziomyces antarcticus]GAK64330.1 hypothetical protein PAN0_005d2543 [Moesziomyces antarcticus]